MESQRALKLFLGGWLLSASWSLAKEKPATAPTPVAEDNLCALHSRWDARTGRLLIPSALPFRFSIQVNGQDSEAFPLAKTDENPESALYFTEGEHNIPIPSSVKQVYRLLADANPPETQFLIPEIPKFQKAGVIYYGKGMQLTLQVSDPVTGVDQTFLSQDEAAFKVLQEKILRFPKDGRFRLRYFSCDRVGNREPTHRLDFSVDVTAPQSSHQVKNNKGLPVLGPSALIALRSQDAGAGVATIQYQMDEGPWTSYESEIVLSGLKPGRHRLTYKAADMLGNEEAPRIFAFSFDASPPELKLAFKGPQYQDSDITYVSQASEVRLVSEDKDSSINTLAAWVNERNQPLNDGLVTLPAVDGLHNLRFVVSDAAGNQTRLESKIFMDTQAPEVEAEILGPSYRERELIVASLPLKVRLRAQDSGAGLAALQYCLNEQDCQPYTKVIEVDTPGRLTLAFEARDRVDQPSKRHLLQFLIKEAQANASTPTQEKEQWVSDPEAGAIGPKKKRFRLEIADGPGENAQRFAISIPVDALDDQYIDSQSLQKIVLSLAGYQAEVNIPIDSVAPTSRHSFADAATFQNDKGLFFGPGLTMNLEADDPDQHAASGVKQIFQSINGNPFTPYKGALKRFLAEQKYSVHYYSVDRVGNREPEKAVEFMLDMTAPKTKADWVGPHFRNVLARAGGIELQAEDSLSGVQAIHFAFDEADFAVYSPDAMREALAKLAAGSHRLRYYAVDQVKNREATQTLEFSIDDSSPALSHHFIGSSHQTGNLAYIKQGAKIALRAQDQGAGVGVIHYKLNQEPEQVYEKALDFKDLQRELTLVYRGSDKVNNEAEAESLTVRLDAHPPASKLQFKGAYYLFDDRIFVRSDTEISVKSLDSDAGVARIYYRINSNDYQLFDKPLKFSEQREYNFSIYAVDRVDNREAPQVYRVIVDDEKPSLQIKGRDGTLLLGDRQLQKDSLIYISAYDSQAGIKDIYYQIGDEAPQLYRQPIRLTQTGPVKLEVRVRDWMGAEESKSVTYQVEP